MKGELITEATENEFNLNISHEEDNISKTQSPGDRNFSSWEFRVTELARQGEMKFWSWQWLQDSVYIHPFRVSYWLKKKKKDSESNS